MTEMLTLTAERVAPVAVMAASRRRAASSTLSNQDVILASIAKLGGRAAPAHVEDIAVTAHKIDPQRFVWSLYEEQIDLEKIRSTIRFMSREEGGQLVVGATRDGWLLSRRGLERVRALATWLPEIVGSDEDLAAAERERVRQHPAVVRAMEGQAAQASKTELDELFRPVGVSPQLSRAVLIERLLNVVGDEAELKSAVQALARRL